MKEWEYRVNNYTTSRQLTIFPQGRCNGVADGSRCMNALPATSYNTFCQKCLLILLAIQGSQGFDTSNLRSSPGRRVSGDMAGDGPNQFHHHVAQAAIIASTTNCTSGDRHMARKSKAGPYTDIYDGIDPQSWMYAEWIVDSGATCMLVPPAFAPFISSKSTSQMIIGGFTKDGTAHGTIHGKMAPHFVVTKKGNIPKAGQTSIIVDVVPNLAQPLMSISDWLGEGDCTTSFHSMGGVCKRHSQEEIRSLF